MTAKGATVGAGLLALLALAALRLVSQVRPAGLFLRRRFGGRE